MSQTSKSVPRVQRKWKNPKTGLICGYERARQLHLIDKADGKILNPKTNKLVSLTRAKSLGLIPKAMAA